MPLKPLSAPITDETQVRVMEVVLACRCADGSYRRIQTDEQGRFVVAGGGSGGGDVTVTNWPSSQAINNWPTGFLVSGTVSVGNFPSSFQVSNFPAFPSSFSVSNFPATQPVSIAAPVAVTGTFWQATQPVSIASPVAVTGTFFQSTQPVSAAALPLPSGASSETTLAAINAKPALLPSSLCVTTTAASGQAATLTLPAVAGQFHYLSSIRISAYNVAARTGGATPVVVTTTNLPGALAFTFGSAGAIGTIESQQVELGGNPMKSSAANTATTIVCPATTNVIWRVTAFYQSGA